MNIDITISLPEELAEKAKSKGMLDQNRIVQLLESEVNRLERWDELHHTFAPARAAFRAEYGHLSEDEVIAFIDAIRHDDNS